MAVEASFSIDRLRFEIPNGSVHIMWITIIASIHFDTPTDFDCMYFNVLLYTTMKYSLLLSSTGSPFLYQFTSLYLNDAAPHSMSAWKLITMVSLSLLITNSPFKSLMNSCASLSLLPYLLLALQIIFPFSLISFILVVETRLYSVPVVLNSFSLKIIYKIIKYETGYHRFWRTKFQHGSDRKFAMGQKIQFYPV